MNLAAKYRAALGDMADAAELGWAQLNDACPGINDLSEGEVSLLQSVYITGFNDGNSNGWTRAAQVVSDAVESSL